MSGNVEMHRNTAERGRDHFTCSVEVWELMWALGRTFGWHPEGTTYRVPPKLKVEVPALRDYQPGNALDRKQVAQEDALSWARALDVAQRSPHLDAMIAKQLTATAADPSEQIARLRSVLEEFVEFAYGGAFTFAVAT
jgi:hypothetical protein